jgi:hypothetical protein
MPCSINGCRAKLLQTCEACQPHARYCASHMREHSAKFHIDIDRMNKVLPNRMRVEIFSYLFSVLRYMDIVNLMFSKNSLLKNAVIHYIQRRFLSGVNITPNLYHGIIQILCRYSPEATLPITTAAPVAPTVGQVVPDDALYQEILQTVG